MDPALIPRKRINLPNFYKVFFDFTYFLFISPFRIIPSSLSSANEKHRHDGLHIQLQYKIHSRQPQKFLCGFFSFLTIFSILAKLRKNVPTSTSGPSQFFDIVLELSLGFIHFLTIKLFWRDQATFLKIFNFLNHDSFYSISTVPNEGFWLKFFSRRWTNHGICMFGAMGALVSIISDMFGSLPPKVMTWTRFWLWFWRKMERDACYNFFFGNDCQSSAWKQIASTVFAVPTVICFFYENIFRFFARMLMLISGLALWSAAKLVASNYDAMEEESGNGSESQVGNPQGSVQVKVYSPVKEFPLYGQLKALQQLAKLINKTIGTIATLYVIAVVFYYAIKTDDFFQSSRGSDLGGLILRTMRLLCFFVLTVFFYVFSADVCFQVIQEKFSITLSAEKKFKQKQCNFM